MNSLLRIAAVTALGDVDLVIGTQVLVPHDAQNDADTNNGGKNSDEDVECKFRCVGWCAKHKDTRIITLVFTP